MRPLSKSDDSSVVRRHAVNRGANGQEEEDDDDVEHQLVQRRPPRHGVEDAPRVAREALHLPDLGGAALQGMPLLAQGRVDLPRCGFSVEGGGLLRR